MQRVRHRRPLRLRTLLKFVVSKLVDRVLTVAAVVMTAVTAVVVAIQLGGGRDNVSSMAVEQVSATEVEQWLDGRLLLGDPAASVTVVVFSDFMCPFCQKFAADYSALVANWHVPVRVIFRHLPLTVLHPRAREWAAGASCADSLGHFPRFHDLAFKLQSSLDSLPVWRVAQNAGVADSAAFHRCLHSGEVAEEITADSLAASRLGVTGTPTFVVGSHRIVGSPGRRVLDSLILASSHTSPQD